MFTSIVGFFMGLAVGLPLAFVTFVFLCAVIVISWKLIEHKLNKLTAGKESELDKIAEQVKEGLEKLKDAKKSD